MKDTMFDVHDELLDRVCLSSENDEKWFAERNDRPASDPPRGAGGLYSTMEDLQKFGQMMINKGSLNGVRILSRKTVESMTRNHLNGIKSYCWGSGGIEMEYGLGFHVYSNNTFLSPGSFCHEGAGVCGLYMDPVENFVFVYMCPLAEGVGWQAKAVINLRNVAWSGIL